MRKFPYQSLAATLATALFAAALEYRTILYAPKQTYFDQNKDYLLKLGVKMADW